MKKTILLILVFTGFTIQAQRYLRIANPTVTSTSRFQIPDNDNIDVTASQSKTITFKMRVPVGVTNGVNFGRIIQKIGTGTAPVPQYGITLGSPASDGYRFTTAKSGTLYGSGNVAVPTLTDGNWHHIVMVLNDANDASKRSKFYIDGTLVYTTTAPNAIDMSNSSILVFGSSMGSGTPVTMDIDDIRFYNTSFTPSDISTDSTTTLVDNLTPNILAAYDFDGGTLGTGTIPEVTGITNVSGTTIDGTGANNTIALVGYPNLWTGTTDTSWTTASNWSLNAVPIPASPVTIGTGTYQPTIASNVSINSLVIESGASLNVTSGNLTVTGAVTNNGTMTLENNANLIQAGTTNNNTGNVIVKRNSSNLKLSDYTLWSSPVADQNLLVFSPNTSITPSIRFYNYNTTFNTGGVNGAYSEVADPAITDFAVGSGYLIRMPADATTTPTAYPGVFTGIPNNGIIPVPLIDGAATGLRYNLVGNPYPSPIKMQNFVFDNTANIEPTLYFWRKTNGEGTAYCTWTAGALVTDPGTFVTNGNLQTVDPADIIQTGQGFFVEAKSGATSLSFRNSQRVANNTGQFFKTKQGAETSKIWLNATSAAGYFSQMAITYFEGATTGVDTFDAKYFNDSPIALTSNINNAEYTIDGRPAFDANDVVALNFKTNAAGDYTIAIDHTMGVFSASQDIYLVDKTTGAETDLKAGAYTFNAAAGTDNTRFSLKYQKTLKVGAPAFNENSVSVYKNNGTLYVNSGLVAISNISVYDVQGRLISEQRNVKATTTAIKDVRANQVLIVKIVGEDNSEVTKKVVN